MEGTQAKEVRDEFISAGFSCQASMGKSAWRSGVPCSIGITEDTHQILQRGDVQQAVVVAWTSLTGLSWLSSGEPCTRGEPPG